jgi:putative polyhydroxyalkanoate system protein
MVSSGLHCIPAEVWRYTVVIQEKGHKNAMSKIFICRQHQFDHDELVSHVEQLAGKLVEKYGGNYEWQGNDLIYEYSGGLTARVKCSEDEVNVDVKLGMLMAMVKSTIAREIENYMDSYIGKP